MIQDKAQSVVARFSCLPVGMAQNSALQVIYKSCNAVLDHPDGSDFEQTPKRSFMILHLLAWTSREAVVRGVAPLGKDSPCQYRAASQANGKGKNCVPARRA